MDIFSEHLLVKEIGCNDNHISEVEQLLTKLSKKIDLDEDKHFRMKLSLTEAIYNAMVHGNGKGRKKTVLVSCVLLKNCVRFMIKDEGNGYEKCKQVINDKENGRGLLIIEELADQFILHENGRSAQIDFNVEENG